MNEFLQAGPFISDLKQAIVRDHDQRVHHFLQPSDALFGRLGPLDAFEREGARDHANGQSANFFGHLSDDRGCARTGAASDPGGDEDHVGPLEHFIQLFGQLFGGFLPNIGIAARP